MAFRKQPQPSHPPLSREQAPLAPAPGRLGGLLQQEPRFPPETLAELEEAFEQGRAFYEKLNESRLQLAYEAFDPDMRLALFEILYLLHVNDPSQREVRFPVTQREEVNGVPQEVTVEETHDLYVAGAPHGVLGLEALSPILRDPFAAFVAETFGRDVWTLPPPPARPIVAVQSIGSIGTIGHKSGASDLDLQVIYDLFPSGCEAARWDDETFLGRFRAEQRWWVHHFQQEDRLHPRDAAKPEFQQALQERAARRMAQDYPHLARHLRDLRAGAAAATEGALPLVNEVMRLVKRSQRIGGLEEANRSEALLKERIHRIQDYIGRKYPRAEIYLFTYSVDMLRAGIYVSSLDFKESSGSAYELILNYETLLPGILFSPVVPAHFLLPAHINNDEQEYGRLLDFIAFDKLELFRDLSGRMVDLGPVPDLGPEYVARHGGAVYWEAFKAASGNLPKATLNLLRYEMLLHPFFNKTIIQIIKEPGAYDRRITPAGEDEQANQQALRREDGGVPTWYLRFLEFDHPLLLKDPWWLRYKALKIAFAEPEGLGGLEPDVRRRISRLLDLAFALHIRISDVFSKPGQRRALATHRERVLHDFLEHAFPPGTDKRTLLQHIFAGEVRAVSWFEDELRKQFRGSLARAQQEIARHDLLDAHKRNQEVRLWRHYYEENFEPKPNMVRTTIMHHLKVPRGRLRIGFLPGEGWFFQSLQRESSVGRRFDTFGMLDHLPEEVTLIEKSGFLAGLVHCIINGYYGILHKGTLRESRTALEFDRAHMNLGDRLDNSAAFLRPDHIDRITDLVLAFFPPEPHHYMDFFRQDRRLRRMAVFLNLWKYGRVTVLARDNLETWYCDAFDHPDLERDAHGLRKEPSRLLTAQPIHDSLDDYLRRHALYIDEVELATWVNPNSVDTPHSSQQMALKERELAAAFRQAILRIHPKLNKEG